MLLYEAPGRQMMSAQERLASIWQRLRSFYEKSQGVKAYQFADVHDLA
jgi:hypothetical protein